MKRPQTDRARAKRAAASKFKMDVCPRHGDKVAASSLWWRCGCSRTQ